MSLVPVSIDVQPLKTAENNYLVFTVEKKAPQGQFGTGGVLT
jgi:hypothetical protein